MKSRAILVLAGMTIVLVIYAQWTHTPPIRDAQGKPVPNSIASLEKIRIGGVDQYVLIRGRMPSNPVLLFLHGGPGMPLMYLAHTFQRDLENDFVVVQWDRRGAGKSYNRDIPPQSMSVQQEISDTRELTDLLRHRFRKQKIFLIGHSYGSYLGMLVVERFPDRWQAYIGVGQLACSPARNRQIQDAWIRERALSTGNREALRELDGKGPFDREKWLFRFGGELHNETSWLGLLFAGLRAPEYSLLDIWKVKAGVNFTAKHMNYNVIQGALMDAVTAVQVPVYFFTGKYDYTDPFQCTEEYYQRLQAPSKEIVWFENSAHFPFLEEPKKFANEMRRVAR